LSKPFFAGISSYIDEDKFIFIPACFHSCKELFYTFYRDKLYYNHILLNEEFFQAIDLKNKEAFNTVFAAYDKHITCYVDSRITFKYHLNIDAKSWTLLAALVYDFIRQYNLDCQIDAFLDRSPFMKKNLCGITFEGNHALYVFDYLIMLDRLPDKRSVKGSGYEVFLELGDIRCRYIVDNYITYHLFKKHISLFNDLIHNNFFFDHPNIVFFTNCTGLYRYTEKYQHALAYNSGSSDVFLIMKNQFKGV